MTIGFVETTIESIALPALKTIVDRCVGNDSWGFFHSASAFDLFKPGGPVDFSSYSEGQLFNSKSELRWKRQEDQYGVLLLSISGGDDDLQPLGKTWKTEDRKANFYPHTEARFPKALCYPKENDVQQLDIGQRYFIDTQTACVQFVSLRVM